MTENKNVVSKLCSDGSVWPIEPGTACLGELANLVNYKIRTEGDIANKHKLNATSLPTAVVDLGKQLLLYAKDSDLTGVQTMLARGAPFTSDWLGMSALHFASMNNQFEICDVLIKGGMNKDIKTKVDRTPLHFAAYYGHERIVEMLLSRKCSVNPKDMLRMTPLHWAIERRHKSIVRLLLQYNADVNVASKFNKTPIGIAVLTEQADILSELQTAKAEQAKKKFNEEQEKEITNAVGAILPEITEQQTELPNPIDFIEVAKMNKQNSTQSSLQVNSFQQAQDPNLLDPNAINFFKSHGISLMQEEDGDGSKDLLSTALQNGRQLVLSEGGKMLLNETRQPQLLQNNSTIAAAQLTDSNNSNKNKQNDKDNIINISVPTSQKQQNQTIVKSENQQQNNNIRIVSYKEFQNMYYNNANGKPIEKSTPTMSNMRIIRQQNDAINLSTTANIKNSGTNIGNRNTFLNAANLARLASQQTHQQQHRQMKITPLKTATTTTTSKQNPELYSTISSDSKDLLDIIEMIPTEDDDEIIEDENETYDIETHVQATNIKNTNNLPPVNLTAGTRRNDLITTTTATSTTKSIVPSSVMSTTAVRQINLMKRPNTQPTQYQQAKIPANAFNIASKSNVNSLTNIKPTPNVMPLLSTPEICRQLYDMRKQNEELRRRVDSLEKEKEDMRHRIDRLEELLLVERTDEEAYDTESLA